MLHTLFFLFSLVTDSRLVADTLHDGTLLGLANAAVVGLAAAGVLLRNWLANRHNDKMPRARAAA